MSTPQGHNGDQQSKSFQAEQSLAVVVGAEGTGFELCDILGHRTVDIADWMAEVILELLLFLSQLRRG